jgi:L-lactate dehydrogenase complex protein LldG
MDLSSQERFLSRLREALSDVPVTHRNTSSYGSHGEKGAYQSALDAINQRTHDDRFALLENMIAEGRAINLEIVPVKDMVTAGERIQQLAQTKQPERGTSRQVVAWKHPVMEELNLEKRLKEISVPVYFTAFENSDEKASLIGKIANAFIGITSADFCIAESATLVLKTRPGWARSVSLAPSIHVAVVKLEQIIADLNELHTLLKHDPIHQEEGLTRCMTFITGPSKTADIEATMVHGVHGPREVYVYVVTG